MWTILCTFHTIYYSQFDSCLKKRDPLDGFLKHILISQWWTRYDISLSNWWPLLKWLDKRNTACDRTGRRSMAGTLDLDTVNTCRWTHVSPKPTQRYTTQCSNHVVLISIGTIIVFFVSRRVSNRDWQISWQLDRSPSQQHESLIRLSGSLSICDVNGWTQGSAREYSTSKGIRGAWIQLFSLKILENIWVSS